MNREKGRIVKHTQKRKKKRKTKKRGDGREEFGEKERQTERVCVESAKSYSLERFL